MERTFTTFPENTITITKNAEFMQQILNTILSVACGYNLNSWGIVVDISSINKERLLFPLVWGHGTFTKDYAYERGLIHESSNPDSEKKTDKKLYDGVTKTFNFFKFEVQSGKAHDPRDMKTDVYWVNIRFIVENDKGAELTDVENEAHRRFKEEVYKLIGTTNNYVPGLSDVDLPSCAM